VCVFVRERGSIRGDVLDVMPDVRLPGDALDVGAIEGKRTPQREFFIDNLLVRIHLIIVVFRWTGLAPWEFGEHTRRCP